MAETPVCHTCRLRGISRPATVRGWHRSRWRLEGACADHAAALARATPIAPAPAAASAPPPWVSSPGVGATLAWLPLPPRQPPRPRPAPGPVLCRTCQLRGATRAATVRGWHRSRWRLEGACADHAAALARPLPIAAATGAPVAGAVAVQPAAVAAPAAAPPPTRGRRRRPVLAAAAGIVVAGAAAIVAVVATGGGSSPAPAPAPPAVSGASLGAAAAAVRVPHLIGRSLSGARGSLDGVRLVVARRRTGVAPAGVILAQRPRPGVSVPRGSALLVTVALPAPPPAPVAQAALAAPSPAHAAPGTAHPQAPAVATCTAVWGQAWGAFRCR
jgi:hypothetical protein